jgi:PAS domain S-box-containing protein
VSEISTTNATAHKLTLSRAAVGVLVAVGLTGAALLSARPGVFPALHTILDTGMFLLSGMLALVFWDVGVHTGQPFSKQIAVGLAITSLSELLHAFVSVEWTGMLAVVRQMAEVLRPTTWPPAAHLLPIAVGCSVWLLRHGARRVLAFAAALVILDAGLFTAFYWLPRYTAPGWLGITRPALVLVPLLWAIVGRACWRLRTSDRMLSPLTLMAGVLFLSGVSMLYSRSPHDTHAMVAHLGRVAGYLALLLSLLQMASLDMRELVRAERELAGLNEQLEGRVRERTVELASANQYLEAEIAVRREAERALRISHERTHAIFETALDGIITMDHEGQITEFNRAAERIFGHRRSDVMGRPLGDVIVPPDLREQHRRGLANYLATGQAKVLGKRIEITGLRADGSQLPLELSINRMPGDGPPTFAGFLRDITERKLAEAKVQEQLERLNLLHQITRAIGGREDLRSIYQVVLRSLEENLSFDFGCICDYDPLRQELIVVHVGVRSQPLALDLALSEHAHVPIDANGLRRCVQGKLVYEPEIANVNMPFTERLAATGLHSLVAAPLLVESKVFGVFVAARREPHSFSSGECDFLRQLSEHVALAAHQAQLYTSLQQAYNDLRQTQQAVMQQERLRALGQMASGIAHDINNAISPITLCAELLLETESSLSPQTRKHLQMIQRAADDVAKTVARMREFYRQREPQATLSPVQMNALAQQVVDLTHARWSDMPQHQGVVIDMRCEFAPDLPVIMGAESEIREALTNLIFNAVDAMPAGGTLTLRTRVAQRSPGSAQATPPSVVVEVADSGLGMDEETRRRCLEPFFTTKGERGTGLGLAMVYGIVQRHSADLDIESTVGKGTTVRLSFAVPSALSADPAHPEAPLAVPPRLRILVVDDDPLLIKALCETLESDGHDVVAANGGQAGIDAFRAAQIQGKPFEVVITDLGMPRVDGRKVASAVKSASETTPVILLTGWGQRLVAEGEIPPHVDRVLAKPPKLRDLREALAICCPSAESHKLAAATLKKVSV